jgi:hypothetical protein
VQTDTSVLLARRIVKVAAAGSWLKPNAASAHRRVVPVRSDTVPGTTFTVASRRRFRPGPGPPGAPPEGSDASG